MIGIASSSAVFGGILVLPEGIDTEIGQLPIPFDIARPDCCTKKAQPVEFWRGTIAGDHIARATDRIKVQLPQVKLLVVKVNRIEALMREGVDRQKPLRNGEPEVRLGKQAAIEQKQRTDADFGGLLEDAFDHAGLYRANHEVYVDYNSGPHVDHENRFVRGEGTRLHADHCEQALTQGAASRL